MKKSLSRFLGLVSLMVLIGIFSSCKDDTDCKATVNVRTLDEKPVAGAFVILYLDKNGVIDTNASGFTNASGNCDFDFPLEKVLQIHAEKDSLYALGTLKLEAGETVKKTIYMQLSY